MNKEYIGLNCAESIGQYEEFKRCILVCKGKDISCGKYSEIDEYRGCGWYKTFLDDKDKFLEGVRCLTLPRITLEKLIILSLKRLDHMEKFLPYINSKHNSRLCVNKKFV